MVPTGPYSTGPAPLRDMPASFCAGLSLLFTDIDDTLTRDGMLPAGSYSALWDLAAAGIRVVPVTGRPAGWCDHIARMWPVAGVVGENGAFIFVYDREKRRMLRRSPQNARSSRADREVLAAIAERVLKAVPGAAVAADQAFRVSDFAIDFREDVPPLSDEAVDRICTVLSREGVHFKVSSIHVNFWLGDFDKMSGVRLFLSAEKGKKLSEISETAVFIGDSPNDEPLFAGFPHSIAVGNLRRFMDRIEHRPEFITEADAADGFCEAASYILSHRAVRTADQ
jgi:HAD superfamily hydrolase (TIGR01484 family)